MRCKLSDVGDSRVRPRILPALLQSSLLVTLLSFALVASNPTAHAQSPSTDTVEGSISGIVFFQGNDHPAAQVAVSLKSHEAGIFRSVLTDYDGHFEIQGLPLSKYDISIEEQGYEPFRSTAQLDGPFLKLELHLTPPPPSQSLQNAYTVSVRELQIPEKAHGAFKKGLERLAKKDLAGSLSLFVKAAQLFPGYFEAFYHQGVIETKLGQLEKALQAFQKSIDLSGGRYAKAVFGIGYLRYLQGKPQDAETTIRRGLEMDPNSADGYLILGMTLLRLDRPDEAEKSAREALLRNPHLASAYLVMADSCGRRQNYLEQIQHLDSYLRMDPASPASQRVQEVREVARRILNRISPQN
jgi:tetratricopeptide (TPR) repeat protein